ncbi:hypothetical protein HDU97_008649 [Phlyctochytrium planicorne]|nr:hypothetical protein HDU97_008649 [Phlyctochytrium planicorne]
MSSELINEILEAAARGDKLQVEMLLRNGVSVNSQHHINQWTPLHWALKRGHFELAQSLLSQGADLHAKNSKGETPVDVAADSIRELMGFSKGPEKAPSTFVPNYLRKDTPEPLEVPSSSSQPPSSSEPQAKVSKLDKEKDDDLRSDYSNQFLSEASERFRSSANGYVKADELKALMEHIMRKDADLNGDKWNGGLRGFLIKSLKFNERQKELMYIRFDEMEQLLAKQLQSFART